MLKYTGLIFHSFCSKTPKQYSPLIISGCSGSGKSTLISFLTQKQPQLFKLSVSHTTRAPRQGQRHEEHYYFSSLDQFNKNIRDGKFIQHFQVHGNMYGTNIEHMNRIIKQGKICILDVDLQGGQKIYSRYPQWNYLFVKCTDLATLRERLQDRNTQSLDSIETRMKNAQRELQEIQHLKYYKQLVNNDIEQAKKDLAKYVNQKYMLKIQV